MTLETIPEPDLPAGDAAAHLGKQTEAHAVGQAQVTFQRILPSRMSAAIVAQITSLIRSGALVPGERLPSERDLCEQFAVSRVTVREAFRVLEANGLLVIRVGARGGTFVSVPSGERISRSVASLLALPAVDGAHLTEARQTLEIGILPLACERADDADIARLVELCEHAELLMGEPAALLRMSADFHVQVARTTHNAAIEMLVQSFHGSLVSSLQRARFADRSLPARGWREHRLLVDAIAARDAPTATRIMSTHLARTAARLGGASDTRPAAGGPITA
jgi:GntR family transcriptional regulator, transcriptional repressor for pyruvate dehydrogenase complex